MRLVLVEPLVREHDHRAAGPAQFGLQPGQPALGQVGVLPVEILPRVGRAVGAEAGVEDEKGDTAGLEGGMPARRLCVRRELLLGQRADAVVAHDIVAGHLQLGVARLHGPEPPDLSLHGVRLVNEIPQLGDEGGPLPVHVVHGLVQLRQGLAVKARFRWLLVRVVQVRHQAGAQERPAARRGGQHFPAAESGQAEGAVVEKGAACLHGKG